MNHKSATFSLSFALLISSAASAQVSVTIAQSPPASSAPSASAPRFPPSPNRPFAKQTPCKFDRSDSGDSDPDIKLATGANLNVMYHGNRFVAAKELTAAFEAKYPDIKVSYTAIPPVNTFKALRSDGKDAGEAGQFMPDVVMGPAQFDTIQSLTTKEVLLEKRALYSRANGLVLMARANDKRVSSDDWRSIVLNPDLKLVLPGEQARSHLLVSVYASAFGQEGLDALASQPRLGVSSVRHHRAIPSRIAGACEDVGIQFLQSKPYWEAVKPGVFKFIPVTDITPQQLAVEDSFVYVVKSTPRKDAAQKFVDFITSPAAVAILKRYDLQP